MEELLKQILGELKTMNTKLDKQQEFSEKAYAESLRKSRQNSLAAIEQLKKSLPPQMHGIFDAILKPEP